MSDVAETTLLDSHGLTRQLDAFVIACAFDRAGKQAAFALGDGTLRLITLTDTQTWQTITAHDGAILTLSPDAALSGFVTGGDDGTFIRTTSDATTQTIANFGGKWVEQTASFWDGKSGIVAAAASKLVHLFKTDGTKLRSLEHPSTVTGIAFDARGKRIAASHYNGASLWFVNSDAKPRLLEWKGSHTGIAIHPAAEAVVSAMQENALHGWRLPDGHDMRMSGYPTKPESLAFTRSGKYLASAGADTIVLWPFFGGGPMGKPPVELAQLENIICTRIACHPIDEVVAAGYTDGSVLIAEIATKLVLRIAAAEHGPISALAWSPNGQHLAFGTEQGFAALLDFKRSVGETHAPQTPP